MRVIVIGDKSRYQFLRFMTEAGGTTNDQFKTEQLGLKTVKLLSNNRKNTDDIFYSEKLPLSTEIVFPAEADKEGYVCGFNDKIIFFDEFPYRTQEKVKSLSKFLEHNHVIYCEVILLINDRKSLKSDISSEMVAMEEAYERYLEEGIPVYKYKKGDNCDFLFWRSNSYLKTDLLRMRKNINAIRTNVFESALFEWDYELEFIKEIDKYCNPAILEALFAYDKNKVNQNATKYFINNACEFFWGSKTNRYVAFAEKMYINSIKNICVWDLKKDLVILYRNIISAFLSCFDDIPKIVYFGTEDFYSIWINENIKIIIDIKNRIVEFFKVELCNVIKTQIEKRIEKLEELLDEKDI